jgi:5-methyltetrahydropteroyltriglutamate--homocysteine methyltransferase
LLRSACNDEAKHQPDPHVFIEHPELVAERITRLANLVGRENVIACTDCGLGGRLPREIVWSKFNSKVEGARQASKGLWA